MTPQDASIWIKRKAHEIGFTHVGIARAERLEAEGVHLDEWLSRGFDASMGWIRRNNEKRKDPREVLPSARSMISFGLNYYHPVRHFDSQEIGKISRYAWGDDYHLIVGVMLNKMEEMLKGKFDGIEVRSYVDTGPVMDKAWAVRSGVGWLGKHTNVITRDSGSWIFLSEIITSFELEPDSPIEDFCGTCTKCIEACPTKAIVEPYVVDSSKCLSYLTIEHRGPIEPALHDKFENWIYGCDICQDVCPWNERFSVQSSIEEFKPREGNAAPKLREWEEMEQEEFSRRFKKSAIKRAKVEGLRRNVGLANDKRQKIKDKR